MKEFPETLVEGTLVAGGNGGRTLPGLTDDDGTGLAVPHAIARPARPTTARVPVGGVTFAKERKLAPR